MITVQHDMFIPANLNTTEQRERLLQGACDRLAGDLKKIDPLIYILYFELGQMPEICFEVNNIVERHFDPGSMSFACTGEGHVSWEGKAQIGIDLEFVTERLFVFFRVFLSGDGHTVQLHHVSFNDSSGNPVENTRLMKKELIDGSRKK